MADGIRAALILACGVAAGCATDHSVSGRSDGGSESQVDADTSFEQDADASRGDAALGSGDAGSGTDSGIEPDGHCTPPLKLMPFAKLAGCDLRGIDARGVDLTEADLTGTLLDEAILDGANLSGADLSNASMDHVRALELVGDCPAALPEAWECVLVPYRHTHTLVGPTANLIGASFYAVADERADLRDLDLRNAVLVYADLTGARMNGADLTNADLRGARLDLVDLRGANLRDANMDTFYTRLLAAFDLPDCRGAVLWPGSRCELQPPTGRYAIVGPDLDLTSADLRDVDLRDLNLGSTSLLGADLSGAELSGTELSYVSAFALQGECPIGLDARYRCVVEATGLLAIVGPVVKLNDNVLDTYINRWTGPGAADLSGSSFDGFDLSDADATDVRLRAASLVGANLSGASLFGADLEDAVLAGALLDRCNLLGASFRDADLRGASLTHTDMRKVRLERADLTDATLTDANMQDARLEGADFTGADLTGVQPDRVRGCPAALPGGWKCVARPGTTTHVLFGPYVMLEKTTLLGADFSGADGTGARLNDARLAGASFSGTVLTQADLSYSDLTGATFDGATLDEASFSNADLTSSDFGTAVTGDATFDGATLSGALLSSATLDGLQATRLAGTCPALPSSWACVLSPQSGLHSLLGPNAQVADSYEGDDPQYVNLIGADLSGLVLTGIHFDFVDLTDVDLSGADLTGAVLDEVVLRNATLVGTDLTDAQLESVDLQGADLTGATLTGSDWLGPIRCPDGIEVYGTCDGHL